MKTEAIDLVRDGERVTGLKARTLDGEIEIAADVVIGADGRHSMVRERAGLQVIDLDAPMDVLWMRITRRSGDPAQSLGHADAGAGTVRGPGARPGWYDKNHSDTAKAPW